MKNTEQNLNVGIELPMQLYISFQQIFALFQKYADVSYQEHPFHKSSKEMLRTFEKVPELMDGFSDISFLEKYEDFISLLLEPLFPEPLLHNEIKAAMVPFSFHSFKFTTRLENILKNAGNNYDFKIRDFQEGGEDMYIMACTFILNSVYGYTVDLKRPLLFDIPDKITGVMKHYRAVFNADFSEIILTKHAPKITEEDYKELLDNFDNIEVWKKKFPPNSYIYKGFGIVNLFDVTADETISSIRKNLLNSDDDLIENLQQNLREFFAIDDLMLGFSVFDSNKNLEKTTIKKSNSLLFENRLEINCNDFFCNYIVSNIFYKKEIVALSDVERYGRDSKHNSFYKRMQKRGIKSIILVPISSANGKDLAILEIASLRPFELNSINQNKLKEIIPSFEAAVKRASEEHQNILDATIQEHYTSIHQTVKWRFYEAVEKYHQDIADKSNSVKLDEIVFNDVYPLFGQSDIKGSSLERNKAIKEDLTTQLSLAISVLNEACKKEDLPIYNELVFRINEYLEKVKKGLKAGDEINILDFLKREIYPVFNHIKEIDKDLQQLVEVYMNRLDTDLHVVYEKRKNYEHSVTLLNNKLAKFLDTQQEEAQAMFPHYFERYITDGIEYNMYIGDSLVKEKDFDLVYLYNLRLWQLQMMCALENVAYVARKEMDYDLRVASLILVHSNAMAIKFRMDEKQFDVDGAYNIRYEIIKKRIDKAYIRNTKERLTIPGKIAIVYSQEKDALEYLKYIKFLQSQHLLGTLEKLELEDLQGVSGLKALRVSVVYQKDFDEKNTISFNDLIKELET